MREKIFFLCIVIFLLAGCTSYRNNIVWEPTANIIRKNLKIGDVIVTEPKNTGLSWFGHCGIVVEGFQILEIPKLGSEVHFTDLDGWAKKNSYMVILRPKEIDNNFRVELLNVVKQVIGKPYIISFDKSDNNGFYCSQLVWYLYFKAGEKTGKKGISDGLGGILIMPSDFLESTKFIPIY